jgi:hypothetical protein
LRRVLGQRLIKAKYGRVRKRLRHSGAGGDRDNRKRRDRAANICATKICTADCRHDTPPVLKCRSDESTIERNLKFRSGIKQNRRT